MSMMRLRPRPWPPSLGLGRHWARLAVRADGDEGEEALGHLDALVAEAAARPAFDVDGNRGAADLDHLAEATHLIAHQDRAMEGHGGDRHPGDAPARALRPDTAARHGHLRQPPPATTVAPGIGVRPHRH